MSGETPYRLMFDRACEGILLAQGGHIRFANPKTEDLFGLQTRALRARPFTQFLHPEDRGLVMARHVRRLHGDSSLPDRYQFRITRGTGEIARVELKLSVIAYEGKPATLCFLDNVTPDDNILRVAPDAAWFCAPHQEPVDMRRKRILRQVLRVFVERRTEEPGVAISVPELFDAGWRGASIRPGSAAQRVYVAVGTLRDLGLDGILVRQRNGYLLDPAIPIETAARPSS